MRLFFFFAPRIYPYEGDGGGGKNCANITNGTMKNYGILLHIANKERWYRKPDESSEMANCGSCQGNGKAYDIIWRHVRQHKKCLKADPSLSTTDETKAFVGKSCVVKDRTIRWSSSTKDKPNRYYYFENRHEAFIWYFNTCPYSTWYSFDPYHLSRTWYVMVWKYSIALYTFKNVWKSWIFFIHTCGWLNNYTYRVSQLHIYLIQLEWTCMYFIKVVNR